MKNLLLAFVASLLMLTMTLPVNAQIDEAKQQACTGSGGSFINGECVAKGGGRLENTIRSVTNILIFIIGAIAVLMLIIGGLRYVLSGGDSQGVEGAKNTILYSVVGIIVAFMAYAIVNFIIDRLEGP